MTALTLTNLALLDDRSSFPFVGQPQPCQSPHINPPPTAHTPWTLPSLQVDTVAAAVEAGLEVVMGEIEEEGGGATVETETTVGAMITEMIVMEEMTDVTMTDATARGVTGATMIETSIEDHRHAVTFMTIPGALRHRQDRPISQSNTTTESTLRHHPMTN